MNKFQKKFPGRVTLFSESWQLLKRGLDAAATTIGKRTERKH